MKLTKVEKILLENLDSTKEELWIARDESGDLYIHFKKPKKENACWFCSKTAFNNSST